MNIKLLVFDVDGVITDGRKYLSGEKVIKSVSMKDVDAFSMIKDLGIRLACITGEDDAFANSFKRYPQLDEVVTGSKDKLTSLSQLKDHFKVENNEICYIGDGKYDIPVLKEVGLSICPADAISEAKKEADIVLKRKGGEGCIADIYSILKKDNHKKTQAMKDISKLVLNRVDSHIETISILKNDTAYWSNVQQLAKEVCDAYNRGGCLYFCGNGGSAADSQHLAAELVGRFYKERRALNAEALTTNSSILTCLANDYDYNIIFARQIEARGKFGDVIIGITTSGTSKNISLAFEKAKAIGIKTVLMTGNVSDSLPLVQMSDYVLKVPSKDTPRIQEMHILTGHILCELIENIIMEGK